MVEAGYHQEVHLREYLDILQSGGHRAQPVPLQARDARPAPPCPEYGNAGVRMLAGVLEVSLVHRVRDDRAHRKVVLALSVQGKSMLSLTEDPSPRSLGIEPTLA